MYSRLFGNRSMFGFYSPQRQLLKNNTSLNEVEIYQDEILKLKMELNKKTFEFQELRIEYNRLDKAYKSNIILLEKLINEANSNILNNLSNDKDNENTNQEFFNKNKLSKNTSKSIENNKNINYKNKTITSRNNILNIIGRNHLNQKLQQEIIDLKNEIKVKESIINNYKNNANVLKYKELDKKYSKIFSEFIQTRENNDKLKDLCETLNIKINNYKQKVNALKHKNKLIENENEALKKKLSLYENKQDNSINSDNNIHQLDQKKNDTDKEEDIQTLKEKINSLIEENKKLKEKQ